MGFANALPILLENIQLLRQAIKQVQTKHPFTLEAITVLPDHLHCIWTLPDGDDDFSNRWRQIKSRFSRGLAAVEEISDKNGNLFRPAKVNIRRGRRLISRMQVV